MKYFIDTEFIEGTQNYGNPYINIWIGKKQPIKPTIDLISIGIVAEDGREYYAVSKDFNLKEAWNRHDIKKDFGKPQGLGDEKVYWIRDNVLKPIYLDLLEKSVGLPYSVHEFYKSSSFKLENSDFKQFKYLINKYGKSNKQIAKEVEDFCKPIHMKNLVVDRDFYWHEEMYKDACERHKNGEKVKLKEHYIGLETPIQFYSYFADYDWVVFCWLFGKMINLPTGFPMYCIDLKQTLDEKAVEYFNREDATHYLNDPLEEKLRLIKNFTNYPKQTNAHNALSDARWNLELYKFLNTL